MKLLAAAGLAALLLVGCSKAAAAPTKAEYAAVADSVCARAAGEVAEMVAKHRETGPDGGDDQRFVRFELIPRLRAMSGELRSISPPEDDGAYLDDIYGSFEHALSLLHTDPLGNRADRAWAAAEARMAAYGMEACADLEKSVVPGEAG